MRLFHLLRRWRRSVSNYEPFVRVYISRKAIEYNYQSYQKALPDFKIAPVLKSNAYGHGLVEVAEIVDNFDPPFIAVDSFYEARVLRNAGIKSDILVIGYSSPTNVAITRLQDVAFTVVGIDHLKNLVATVAYKTKVHVKFDTGMHRQGLMFNELEQAIKILKQNPQIEVEGICSHLCDADGEDDEFTKKQLALWEKFVQVWSEKFGETKWQHISATKGFRFANTVTGNVVRLGIGLYGGTKPYILHKDLLPALKMETLISSIRTLPAGEYLGYNITFKTEKETKVANVPVGYFEGVDRRLSNKGFMLVNGEPCKILGRVSMNITSIDVTNVNCKVGDKVVVVSDEPSAQNSIFKMAELSETIPYEILIHIPQHLRREVVD